MRWIALFRLGLPGVILRYAGGREVTLRDLQSMGMTAGINALIVGNYLTTLGRSAEEDLTMLADLQDAGRRAHRRLLSGARPRPGPGGRPGRPRPLPGLWAAGGRVPGLPREPWTRPATAPAAAAA